MRTLRLPLSLLGSSLALAVIMTACGGAAENSAVGLSPDQDAGKKLAAVSCMGCHSTDGSRRTGPSFKGLAGSQVSLEDGSTVTADDNYLTQAITDPDAAVVKGYPAHVMLSAIAPGAFDDVQARQIVEYLKTIR